MTKSDTTNSVLSLLSDQLNKDIKSLEEADRQLHTDVWDSIKHVEILLSVKEIFPYVKFSGTDFVDLDNTHKIIQFIEKHTKS